MSALHLHGPGDRGIDAGGRIALRAGVPPGDRESVCSGKTLQGDAIVIGSDQVACLGTQILHKPGTAEAAERQLAASSGQTVHFWTAVSVWTSPDRAPTQRVVPCEVKMRALSALKSPATWR
jgi:predicted house-cleaning NTP pyrophosphatase (Maf/HAM1 superfamily)